MDRSFPYKLGSATYVFSKPRFVYSTILIVCYVASLLNILYRINFNNFTDDNVASLIHTNLFFFLDGCIILVMYAVSRDRLRLLQTVLETSHILSSHDFNNLAKLIHAKDILGSVFLLAHLPRLFAPDLAIALRHLVALYIIIVNFSMDMFYMNCVCVLKTCFKKINESLLQMIKTLSKDESRSEIWMKKMSHQELRNPLLLIRLKHLEDKHLQISDCVQLLNNTYLTRVVVMAMSSFAVITFNLYFYMLWRGGALLDQQYQLWFVPYIISAIYHFLKFALIIWACETATNQSLKIHTTIHDFLSIATDASVKREVIHQGWVKLEMG